MTFARSLYDEVLAGGHLTQSLSLAMPPVPWARSLHLPPGHCRRRRPADFSETDGRMDGRTWTETVVVDVGVAVVVVVLKLSDVFLEGINPTLPCLDHGTTKVRGSPDEMPTAMPAAVQ